MPHPDDGHIRPYLDRRAVTSTLDDAPGDGMDDVSMVRSYTLTGGRTQASMELPFEAMLTSSAMGRQVIERLTFERRDIIRLCAIDMQSVAEVSAKLHVPIGVIRVLAADLIDEGMLEVHVASDNVADDVSLIMKLIEGVRAL